MSEKPTVTLKDTKKEIMSAYTTALATINKLKSQQFNPAEIKTKEANEDAIAHTEEMEWDLPTVFAQMRKTIDGNLRSMEGQLEAEKEELNKVRRAKAALTEELDELYGITTEAQSFAALVEAQRKQKEEFDAELERRKLEVDEYVADRKSAMGVEQDLWKEDKRRQEEAWTYNFTRRCQQEEDKFTDTLADKAKAWQMKVEDEEKELEKRREALAKQEAELEQLKEQVQSFPVKLAKAEEDAAAKAKRAFEFEVRAIKNNHDADAKVHEHSIAVLTKANEELTKKVADLEAKLETAYEKIQGVASKALDAAGNAQTIAEVQKAVTGAGSNKGR